MRGRTGGRFGLILVALSILIGVIVVIETKPGKWQDELMISLLLSADRTTQDISLEDYLVGVVLAEMPASFEFEALKAQAVCARTYTLKKYFSTSGHEGEATICDNPKHCQAFVTPEDYLKRYPDNKWAVNKVIRAVMDTRGEVITLNGQLIEPVYHSTCGGHTESSQTVWGHEHCYLQGVPCLWDSSSPYYRKVLNIPIEEFQRNLNLDPATPPIPRKLESNENGTVAQIAWGKTIMNGQQVRRALDLPSAKFTIDIDGDEVAVTTMGNGHGVGLCQYGANGLAKEGKNYQMILHYYYQDIALYRVDY
ncbi:MAG: stage II sporulation protein D [Syntrophomonadales bacterium]